MKLLLYSWNANNEQILADNLIKLGFEVVWFRKECKHYTRDMELAMEMIPFIHAKCVEVVVSFNYFPIISMICDTCRIPYYSWVYDCPHFTLYAKQIALPCNHIGIFDRKMVRNLEGYGVNTVYHVPLSVDTAYFDRVIKKTSSKESERFRCSVSFVGTLYTDEHNYYDRLFHATARIVGMDKVIESQLFSYRSDYLRKAVAEGNIDLDMIRARMEEQGLMLGEDYFAGAEDILLAAVLEKKVTVEERKVLLTEAAKRFGNDFRLYTGSVTENLPELDCCNKGIVDYHTQMPLVFANSKINLNISLRSIRTGIPLRVLDIMACGGFVLSNRQPEIEENFVEGTEIVLFDNMRDCFEKIEYYLLHEDERTRIAINGQKKVQEVFSYRIGLERLFEIR